MPVDQRKLLSSFIGRFAFHFGDVKSRHQTRSVSAALAVNEEWLGGVANDFENFTDLL